jgi:hypothetical protein
LKLALILPHVVAFVGVGWQGFGMQVVPLPR